jgi:uncharacterized protein (DUF433 family)
VTSKVQEIGVGFYNVGEVSRLTKIPHVNIRRWLAGYTYRSKGTAIAMAPLWLPQLPPDGDELQLGFRDLIELRFVQAFIANGLKLRTIRACIQYAREVVGDDRPFSTQRFQTDGKTIFLDSVRGSGESELLDLKKKQYAIRYVIQRSFKDLDIEDRFVARWRPFKGKASIVVDPNRSFGQPIVTKYGVPTITLAQAAEAEGSVSQVARLFEIPASVIRDAIVFEKNLMPK